jgi:predicted Zn-dependent peptidase
VAWRKKYWGANNAILVVAGDFKKAEMLQKLEATFGTWRNAETKAEPPWPKVTGVAAKYGGRTIDGLARKLGDGSVHVLTVR